MQELEIIYNPEKDNIFTCKRWSKKREKNHVGEPCGEKKTRF